MSNELSEIIRANCRNLSQLSRDSGVPYGTLYSIARGNTNVDNIGINTFISIARALGMTAEELYYGRKIEHCYGDPRQQQMNEDYASLDDQAKGMAAAAVRGIADTCARAAREAGTEADQRTA